jgi:N-methylhydantoinase B
MKTNLMRTAYNLIIYEALDFTVGLLDAKGNTVSIGLGLPMFIRGMSDTAKAKLEYFGGAAGLEPGDVLLTNDAYLTGSHLNHMTFSVPVFWMFADIHAEIAPDQPDVERLMAIAARHGLAAWAG